MTDTNIPPAQNLNQAPNVPPLPIPNRYHTTVVVEYVIHDTVRVRKWFSDIQMAWLWVKKQVSERENQNENWRMFSFETVANGLDIEWRNNNGVAVANCGDIWWEAFYRPTIQYENVRDREEHF